MKLEQNDAHRPKKSIRRWPSDTTRQFASARAKTKCKYYCFNRTINSSQDIYGQRINKTKSKKVDRDVCERVVRLKLPLVSLTHRRVELLIAEWRADGRMSAAVGVDAGVSAGVAKRAVGVERGHGAAILLRLRVERRRRRGAALRLLRIE